MVAEVVCMLGGRGLVSGKFFVHPFHVFLELGIASKGSESLMGRMQKLPMSKSLVSACSGSFVGLSYIHPS